MFGKKRVSQFVPVPGTHERTRARTDRETASTIQHDTPFPSKRHIRNKPPLG